MTKSLPITDEDDISTKRTKWRNLAAFWILGLCNNYGYVVMLSAAHTILSNRFGAANNTDVSDISNNSTIRDCNPVSTGAILLADILPALLIKFVAPFLPYLIHARLATCVIFSAAGLILVALGTAQWMALLGVVLTSLSSGLGEVTLLAYSHQFSKDVISTWSSGTGGAGVIGAGSYAGLTLLMSDEDTLMLMLIVPFVEAATFWLLLVHPSPGRHSITKNDVDSQEQIIETREMTFVEKLRLVPKLLKFMVPLGLVYLFEYFINQGLFELLDVKVDWLKGQNLYRWLNLDYQIGVFISRSSVNLITINKIWIMSVLQLINVIILTCESVFYFMHNAWIVLALVLWEGLLGGAAYVNTFYRISKEVPLAERQASLGITTMADSIGIALAGWISMPVHNAICKLPKP
ncbi:battenin [Prorops nasuta]|uniref:battenin n=1 Tax=Prorops nasuta TaxID=863751 RepID=UPI0034D00F84